MRTVIAQSAANMDFSGIGTAIAADFNAVGNALLVIGGGLAFVSLVIIGLSFFAVPLNRRVADGIKTNIGWVLGGCAFCAAAGVLGKAMATAIEAGKV